MGVEPPLLEPALELLDRIRVEIDFAQPHSAIVLAQVGEPHGTPSNDQETLMRIILASGGFRTPERIAFLASKMRHFFGNIGRLSSSRMPCTTTTATSGHARPRHQRRL